MAEVPTKIISKASIKRGGGGVGGKGSLSNSKVWALTSNLKYLVRPTVPGLPFG